MTDAPDARDPLPSDWVEGPDAIVRRFSFPDAFGPFDLASILAPIAIAAGVTPQFQIEGRRLTVRVESDNEYERGRFQREVDRLLDRRQAMQEDRNPRPARALTRLWLEAQAHFRETVEMLTPGDLDQPTTPGAKETILEEAIRHTVSAGFGYLAWTRRVLNLPDTHPGYTREQLLSLETVDEIRAALGLLQADVEATLEGIPEGVMEDRGYLSNWGRAYTVDQMLEHAVMHLHRHRRQIEGYLEVKDRKPGS